MMLNDSMYQCFQRRRYRQWTHGIVDVSVNFGLLELRRRVVAYHIFNLPLIVCQYVWLYALFHQSGWSCTLVLRCPFFVADMCSPQAWRKQGDAAPLLLRGGVPPRSHESVVHGGWFGRQAARMLEVSWFSLHSSRS